MKEYSGDTVRNLALIGPHGAGKTSFAEAMLYVSGASDKLGKVDDGSSSLDYEEEEKKRNMSVNSHIAFCEWDGNLINLVDTPGFSNFLFDTQSSLNVVDGCVLVVGAISGEGAVQGKRYWDMAEGFKLPRMILVNKLDRERTSFDDTVRATEKELGIKVLPITIPIGAEADFKGVIDLIEMKAYTNDPSGKPQAGEIPDDLKDAAASARERIIESVAELDDDLLEKYLNGETLDTDLVYKMLHEGARNSSLFPLFAGSSASLVGVGKFMDSISRFTPSPKEIGPIEAKSKDGEPSEIVPSENGVSQAFVFKTISDPYAGKINIFRVYSGSINGDTTVYNATKESKEKLGHLYKIIGKKEHPLDRALMGDIVAVNKLKETDTGDTLGGDSSALVIEPLEVPQAVLSYAIEPKSRNDEDKLMPSLNRIQEEDPAIQYRIDEETREFLLSGTGQTHVEVVVNKLRDTYGVNVELKTPRVPYRETIRGKAKAEGKYIKQTGGRGQYGDAWVEIEPMPRGGGYEFVNNIVGGAIPKNFIPSVEKGVLEAMKKGVSAGYPVVDVKVTLFDGKYHSVDSSDIAFQIAGSMGFKQAMEQAKPMLLEPIMRMEITIPEESMGDVIGDVNSRRGKVSGVDSQPGSHQINALVPMSEVLSYAPELRSITSGRGNFSMEFSHYEEVPDHLSGKIIAEANKGKESEE